MITKVSGGAEQMFEKEVTIPARKERFTIKRKEAEKVRLQAEIDKIDADIAEAKTIKD
jgi:hypothetical protein